MDFHGRQELVGHLIGELEDTMETSLNKLKEEIDK